MAARSPRIDALRGLAVFGILLVNVWSHVYGFSSFRFGVMDSAMPAADQVLVFFTAAFVESKFYPIFAFLFGAGFALQTRAHGDLDAATAQYRRRLAWLLGCGIVHGTLLWFGDILTSYALVGFWLAGKAGLRLAQLVRSLRILVVVNAGVAVLWVAGAIYMSSMDLEQLVAQVAELHRTHAVYTSASWRDIAHERLVDYGANMSNLIVFAPRLMLLFLLGVLAVRLGWLTQPERHRRAWRTVLGVALLAGLPLNLWWGVVAVQTTLDPLSQSLASGIAAGLADIAGPCLGAGYVALFMLARPTVLAWLAPVGRMALTNYLAQSLLLSLLLQGVGLGLGAVLPRTGLAGICVALMLAQLALSHWWLRHHSQGPVEALWRRYSRSSNSTAGRDAENK